MRTDHQKWALKKTVTWALLSLLLMLTGCVPSLHPLYNAQDVIFDPALLGVWGEKDSQETWAFTKADAQAYKLIYTDEKNKRGEFIVHLVKVEDHLFLDLFPVEPELPQNEFYQGHLLRAHTFMRVSQIEPTLRLACLDPDWLKNRLAKNPAAIRHEKVNDEILLTASTPELQQFLLAHLKTRGAFGEPSEMERQKK
jgi:hypothetical protein